MLLLLLLEMLAHEEVDAVVKVVETVEVEGERETSIRIVGCIAKGLSICGSDGRRWRCI